MIFFKRYITVAATVSTSKGEKTVTKRVKMTHKNHIIVLPTRYGELRVKVSL